MKLKQLIIDKDSSLLGKSIRESAIRNKYKCLIVALDREGESLITPDINEPLKEGDIMWVVGESQNLHQLVEK
jgi:CPA2 family monovalent cation:H+ antiporter-2